MANPLTEALPAKVRKVLYLTSAIAGVAIPAIQVAYSAAGTPSPVWLTVALAVYAFLGGSVLNITAASNITKPDANDPPEPAPRRALGEPPEG